jgi:ketosteroid isomerase-like protein
MLQASIDVIRAAYDAYNRGDLDDLIDFYSEDAEMEVATLGQNHRGRAEIRRSFEDFFEVVDAAHTDPLDFVEQGRQVVVPVRLTGRLRHTGITGEMLPTEMVHAFEVRDGKIVWNYICTERDDAVAAASLRTNA